MAKKDVHVTHMGDHYRVDHISGSSMSLNVVRDDTRSVVLRNNLSGRVMAEISPDEIDRLIDMLQAARRMLKNI